MNKVLLTGRITKDPEIRYTPTGVATVTFSLAVDKQFKDQNGQRQADFITCVAWRQQAEFISRYIKKGYMLAVEGRIQSRSYQAQDNTTKYVTEVVIDQIENLQPRDNTQQNPQGFRPQSVQQQNPYQGYNNPSYGAKPQGQPMYQPNYQNQQPSDQDAPQSFNVDVADDDLPF